MVPSHACQCEGCKSDPGADGIWPVPVDERQYLVQCARIDAMTRKKEKQ